MRLTGCTETSVITNPLCVTLQYSKDLIYYLTVLKQLCKWVLKNCLTVTKHISLHHTAITDCKVSVSQVQRCVQYVGLTKQTQWR
jgi:hypothetical protein